MIWSFLGKNQPHPNCITIQAGKIYAVWVRLLYRKKTNPELSHLETVPSRNCIDRSETKCFGWNFFDKNWICHLNVHKKLSTTVVIWSACGHVVALESILPKKWFVTLWGDPWGFRYPNWVSKWSVIYSSCIIVARFSISALLPVLD